MATSRPMRRIRWGWGFHFGSVSATTTLAKATISKQALRICFLRLTVTLIFWSIALVAKTLRARALRQKHQT